MDQSLRSLVAEQSELKSEVTKPNPNLNPNNIELILA